MVNLNQVTLPVKHMNEATGFNLSVLDGIKFSVVSKIVDFSEKVGYRGMLFTNVPNIVWVMGYFRPS